MKANHSTVLQTTRQFEFFAAS